MPWVDRAVAIANDFGGPLTRAAETVITLVLSGRANGIEELGHLDLEAVAVAGEHLRR